MTTYGFKYNGEGETTYYNIEGISLDMLIEGKYYSREKDGCYLYVGTSMEETSELMFYCVGGPYDDSICSEESQFVYHFVNGECNTKMQINSYCRRVTLNYVQIEPEINKYYGYHNPKAGSVDKCYLYLGKVLYDEQRVIDTLVLTSEHNNCGCFDSPLSFEFYNCLSGEISKFNHVNLNSGIELIENKFYKESKDVCYQFFGLKQEHASGTLYIKEGPFEDCDCEYKPEPPTTENSECVVSTCKGTEQHINVSNDILNLLDLSLSELNGNHTFKWNNKCYYIVKVVGEENPELQIMDIEHLNGIYPGCTECNNDGITHKDNTEYYEKVNCEFANAVYNKAISDRYGVEFCCEKDLTRSVIKKKLLDAVQLQDEVDLC